MYWMIRYQLPVCCRVRPHSIFDVSCRVPVAMLAASIGPSRMEHLRCSSFLVPAVILFAGDLQREATMNEDLQTWKTLNSIEFMIIRTKVSRAPWVFSAKDLAPVEVLHDIYSWKSGDVLYDTAITGPLVAMTFEDFWSLLISFFYSNFPNIFGSSLDLTS